MEILALSCTRILTHGWVLQSKKLEAEVLAPMNRWTTAFSTVEVSASTLCQLHTSYSLMYLAAGMATACFALQSMTTGAVPATLSFTACSKLLVLSRLRIMHTRSRSGISNTACVFVDAERTVSGSLKSSL